MARSLLILPAVVSLLALASHAPADGWGTIKGQFVMADGKLPPVVKLDVNKDQAHCLSKGDINKEAYVVDPKTKGVRWVVVWIAPEKNGVADHASTPPIHPNLANIPANQKQVEMDQPCCKFEPHLVVLRKGQELVGKNSAPIAHNILIQGGNGVNENLSLPPGAKLPLAAERWKPHYYPSSISCSIHPWMQAKLFVIGHPYFAVSDAEGKFEIKNVPADNLRILMWHEGMGWVHKVEAGKKGFNGQAITVEADKTLDLKQVPVKYSAD